MTPEFLLAIKMAVGSTRKEMQEEYLAAIIESRGSTEKAASCKAHLRENTIETLLDEIQALRGAAVTEHSPAAEAVDRAVSLITDAGNLVGFMAPAGEVDFYFGELGVEWRRNDRILRLTCFGDATPPRIDYGIMSVEAPGQYRSGPATAGTLATQLDWLAGVAVAAAC
jgi:hypothetical protein